MSTAPAEHGGLDEQQLAERIVAKMMERDEFSRWLGIDVTRIAPNTATVRMTVRREMVNGFVRLPWRHRILPRRQRARVRLEHAWSRDGEHREQHSVPGDHLPW